jgi:uncharacterized cofD-like protein
VSSSGRRDGRLPRRIVALGGGTGLPGVLRGLRSLASPEDTTTLTAIVAMSDDGGSSGRLRRSRGLPPPGDVRNCLVALSAEEDLLAGIFQHRYDGEPELGGHNLGNLILAALAEQTGSFLRAVDVSSRVLRTVGRILPVTLEDVVLEARLEDGSSLEGESAIGACEQRIVGVALRPDSALPTPGVVEAIRDADLVVLGPGSLFTSVIPCFALGEVARALRNTAAARVLVANLVGERGEGAGLEIEDHVRLIEEHAGGPVLDAVLANEGPIDDATLGRYLAEGSVPLASSNGLRSLLVVRRNLLGPGPKLRHDSRATTEGLVDVWRQLRTVEVGEP